MGNCMSAEEKAERERSLAIDKQIEEDSRRFRKECKILLLGMFILYYILYICSFYRSRSRLWRVGQVDDCEADEDYPPERLYPR